MAMMRMVPVVSRVSSTASRRRAQVRVPLHSATTQARDAPTAPASVGVNRPANRPPKMPTMIITTGQTSHSALSRSSVEMRSSGAGASSGFSFTRMVTTMM
ncbi:hypothetical protein ASALC70_02202 [Alcanivorax sp. ALC70]|nr:hypothetical protein ASALC70_02202 [Alcanivorax sp. ALC70]